MQSPYIVTKLFLSGWNVVKGCVCCILPVCILSLNKSTWKPGKMFFLSLQELFSFSRKSDFRIPSFQVSWRLQMPKHKTRNTFHWITWKVNTVWWWNFTSLCHITKEKNSSKNSTKAATWKLVLGPFVFAKN